VRARDRFSPLFIGELSSTTCDYCRCKCVARFQSPLHRGTLFNDAGGIAVGERRLGFSPLFIGELSSTVSRSPAVAGSNSFQSPLHRGTLFNSSK